MKEIEVVLSMPLFHHRLVRKNSIAVVIDILRSTTSIIAALDHGVKSIIPVSSKAEAEVMKHEGYLLAGEEDGRKFDFADFGNSADEFWRDDIIGKEIVYSTGNGTKAFRLTREESDKVVIGGFPNLSVLSKFLVEQNKNIVLVCAGEKNMMALEDQLFAGALGEKLMESGEFENKCDSLTSSISVWNEAKGDLFSYIKQLAQLKNAPNLINQKVLDYTFTLDSSISIPTLHFNHITAINYKK